MRQQAILTYTKESRGRFGLGVMRGTLVVLLMGILPLAVAASDQWSSSAQGTVAGKVPESEWWKAFNDHLLERYIELAVEHNHDVRAAQARIAQARAFVKRSRARRLPEINASAAYINNRLSENGVGAGPAAVRAGLANLEDDFFQAGFDASWEIDVFGSIRKDVSASEARLSQAAEDRRAVLLSVLAEVARTYSELRGAQERLNVVKSNVRIQSESLQLVENKVRTGLARRIDGERAKALLESTRSAQAPLISEIRLAAFRLAVLVGQPPASMLEELLKPAGAPVDESAASEAVRASAQAGGAILTPADWVPLGLPSELLARRPDLRRAESAINAAGADTKSAKADLYPRFSLTASAGLESGSIGNLLKAASGAWTLIPGLHLPIFNRGRIKSRVRASQARLEEAHIRFQQAYLLALEEVEAALTRYGQRQAETRRLESAAQASAEAVRLARILYRRGLSDYLTVLDAERSLNALQLRLAASRTALALDVITLYKALGGGWEIGG